MPGATIDAVIDRMAEIDAALPEHDGVACFNRMYLRVTVAVRDAMAGTVFEDDEFLGHLDVGFADRFFESYDLDARGDRPHRAWAPLFDHRGRRHTLPLQFALAGMNAHINYDLPVSVVATCRELGIEPHADTAQHRDFLLVNQVLDQVDDIIRREFDQGVAATLDHLGGRLDDSVEMWCISEARGVAWTVAETLWALEDHHGPRDLFLGALGQSVAMASRGILL